MQFVIGSRIAIEDMAAIEPYYQLRSVPSFFPYFFGKPVE
jgi:hypothetical protein